ncbi:MAG: ribosome small subunit-dependent GTPase A [Candidatus Pararuminococcus gallinarum]
MKNIQGLIVKALGGFYYVKTTQALFECRARGKFRKIEQTPLVGDEVEISPTEEGKGYVTRILPRRNFLVRPPLANIDRLILVTSIDEPAPNTLVLDKLIAIAEHKEIDPAVVISKADLQKDQAVVFADIYRGCGFDVFVVSNETGEGVDQVRAYLQGKLSAFCGNSGVGKSSLLNRIDERLQLETAHISQKLGRGRHTTRHVELYELPEGGYIADTPGFSSVDLERCEVILKDQLQYCFREFEEYIPQCKFTGCSHTCEKGCAVIRAVEEGKIPISRHENYRALYEDAKNIKEWELK